MTLLGSDKGQPLKSRGKASDQRPREDKNVKRRGGGTFRWRNRSCRVPALETRRFGPGRAVCDEKIEKKGVPAAEI